MGDSALLGAPPLTPDDAAIRRGLLRLSPSQLNPDPKRPFGPARPDDYVYETWAPSIQIGAAFACFFVLLFTCGRLYVRRYHIHRFGFDDAVIIPAALGALLYNLSYIVQSSAGCLGHHMWECTYKSLNTYFIWVQLEFPVFYFTVFTAKLSIALQNRRITYMSGSRWQVVHWVFISMFLILAPTITFLEIFQCRPVDAAYNLIALGNNPDPKSIKCIDRNATSLAYRIIHILTDVALLCVPIVIVFRLHIARRKKARLIAIFAVGGMSTIASIVRNANIVKDSTDFTWDIQIVNSFNIIDVTFTVVVASLPALNVLVDPTVERLKSYTGYSSDGDGHSSFRISKNKFLNGGLTGRRRPLRDSAILASADSHNLALESSLRSGHDKTRIAEEREVTPS